MARSFSFHLPDLRRSGPTCRVTIKPSDPTVAKLRVEKKKVPQIKILALIDTGASTTAISRKVVKALKLVPRGTAKVYTSSKTSEIRNEFDISLCFDKGTSLTILRALDANLQYHSIDCLIGRDVLELGIFTYNGPGKEFDLVF